MCGATPIIGTRYKCSVCDDFDLCENCEPIYEHDEHAFLKIKNNKQQFEKERSSAAGKLGDAVMFGAFKIKQGLSSALTTIKKMSEK